MVSARSKVLQDEQRHFKSRFITSTPYEANNTQEGPSVLLSPSIAPETELTAESPIPPSLSGDRGAQYSFAGSVLSRVSLNLHQKNNFEVVSSAALGQSGLVALAIELTSNGEF